MKINLSQEVDGNYLEIKNIFNEDMLKKLVLPGTKIYIKHFAGMNKGDRFSFLVKNFGLFDIHWEGMISESFQSEAEFYFVDVGESIPWPLKSWSHKHRFINKGEKTLLKDEVSFEAVNKLMGWIVYPLFLFYFLFRKFLYPKLVTVNDL